MAEVDFYQLLEVDRNADGETIKKSFRRLAMQYHPDRNPGNKEAEQKFKEINVAYEVLKDEQKRAAYDRYGPEAFANGGFHGNNGFGGFEFNFGGGGFSDMFSEIFSEFMGGGAYNRPSYAQNGKDMRFDMELSLEEAFKGVKKSITVNVTKVCENCHGHGTADGKEAPGCPHCQGKGKVRVQQGFFIVERACPHCQGTGRLAAETCKKCSGKGHIKVEKTIEVNVPAGIESGTRICLSGCGNAGLRGGQDGDLYVFVSVKEHKIYKRNGADLGLNLPISFSCAALGGEVKIPSIDGEEITVKIPEGIQNDGQIRIKNKGMTVLQSSKRGDLFVKVKVETPINLTQKQKALLREFSAISGDSCQPQTKSFMEKLKTLF